MFEHLDSIVSIDVLAKPNNRAADQQIGSWTIDLLTANSVDAEVDEKMTPRAELRLRKDQAQAIVNEVWTHHVLRHRRLNDGASWSYNIRVWTDETSEPHTPESFTIIPPPGDSTPANDSDMSRRLVSDLLKHINTLIEQSPARMESHLKSLELIQQHQDRLNAMQVHALENLYQAMQAKIEAQAGPRGPLIHVDDSAMSTIVAMGVPLLLGYGLRNGIDVSSILEQLGFDIGGIGQTIRDAAKKKAEPPKAFKAFAERFRESLTEEQREQIVDALGDDGRDLLSVLDMVDDDDATDDTIRDAFHALGQRLQRHTATLLSLLTADQIKLMNDAA